MTVEHIRQSRPDSGIGFEVKGIDLFELVASSLGRGRGRNPPRVYLTHMFF